MTPEQFRNKRLELGLTQGEIAKVLGQTRTHVTRYESGARPITRVVEIAMHSLTKKSVKKWLTNVT